MPRVKQPKGTAIVKWDEKFSEFAKEATKGMDLPSAKFISLRSGKMTYGGAPVEGNALRCVVVGAIHENQFYDPNQKFDPNEAQIPICFAFGVEKEGMAPEETSTEPQCGSCAACPHNQYGSDDRGRGKACKNVVRLALITEEALEDVDAAEVVYLKIPVTSVKNWVGYAKRQIADTLKRPYWAVVTEISLEPDDQSQFALDFSMAEAIEDAALFDPLHALWVKTMEGISFPYVQRERVEKPAKRVSKPARKANTKFAARK